MKKNKILVAKVLIVLIVLASIFLGLVKFARYLEAPLKSFYVVIDDISASVKEGSDILDTGLYKLFNEKIELNVDTKVNYSGINGTKYQNYGDLFTSSFISKINIDKNNNYLDGKLRVSKNDKEYELSYIEKGNNRFIKENDGKYNELNVSGFNYKLIDKSVYNKIFESIKNVIKTNVKIDDLDSSDEKVVINNKSYDVSVTSYTIDANEMKTLRAGIVNSFYNDEDILNYFINLFDIDKQSFNRQMNELLKVNDGKYKLSSYVNKTNSKSLKFTIMLNDVILYSYEYANDYRALTINDSKYILNGNANAFTLTLINSLKESTITYEKNNDNVTGTIKVNDIETNIEDYNLKYDYIIIENENDTSSMSFNVVLYPTKIKKGMSITINSSILISKSNNAMLSEGDYIYKSDEVKTFVSLIDEYLERINNYYNEE